MTRDRPRLQPGVTPEMHDRLVEANADAKQHVAELERLSRISWPSPLSPSRPRRSVPRCSQRNQRAEP
jgi:hypothetical protein